MTKKEKVLQDLWIKADFKKGIEVFDMPQIPVEPYAKKLWIVTHDYLVKLPIKVKKKKVKVNFIIPRGFIFDGASVPRIFKRITNGANNPQKLVAAAVHDYIYRYGNLSKDIGDTLFKFLLRKHYVSGFISRIMFRAVHMRLGGGIAWKGHRKRQKKAGF